MIGQHLTQFLINEQRKIPGATGELTLLLNDVASACKSIGHEVNRGALAGNLDVIGSENVQGEVQKKLDVLSNDIFIRSLEWTGHLAAMASFRQIGGDHFADEIERSGGVGGRFGHGGPEFGPKV